MRWFVMMVVMMVMVMMNDDSVLPLPNSKKK